MQKTVTVEGKSNQSRAERLTTWVNEPTIEELKADLQMADAWHRDFVQRVQDWLNVKNISGSSKPKTRTNRSTVQPKVVRRNAEWRYPSLSEPYLAVEHTFNVKGETWEDVDAAKQNRLVLNKQFRTQMNPVKFIDEYVRTNVDEGTVIVKVSWLRVTKEVETEVPMWEYAMEQDPEIIKHMQMAMELQNTNPQGFQDLPEDLQESIRYTQEKQVWATARQVGTTTAIETQILKNKPVWDIVDYQNIYLDPNCGNDVKKANFAVISFETSKAELLKDGRYQNLDKVNWASNTPLNNPEHGTYTDQSTQFRDELRKRVIAYEYWGFSDIDGNEDLVPIVATWVGNTIIRMEENPFPDGEIPLVIVPFSPVKGAVTGEPDAELLRDNQAIIGAVTRGMIDLMGRSANSQIGTAKGTLDPVNRKRFENGDDYEYNPGMDPSLAHYQHKFPEIPGSALNMLTMQNQEAESMAGVKAFSGGLTGDVYGQVAAGVNGVMDASGQREMSIIRRLSEGLSEIGRKTVKMNGVFLSEEEVVEVTNDHFVKVNREDLLGEFNISVDISSPAIEESKAKDLGFLLQTLGNTVPWEITQKILSEIATLKHMPTLAHAIEEFAPKPDPLAQKRQELEIAKIDAQIQELKSQALLNEAKARSESAMADNEDLNFLEQETGTKHAREMDKQAAQAESNQMLEISKRILAPGEMDTQANKARDVGDALQLHKAAAMMS